MYNLPVIVAMNLWLSSQDLDITKKKVQPGFHGRDPELHSSSYQRGKLSSSGLHTLTPAAKSVGIGDGNSISPLFSSC